MPHSTGSLPRSISGRVYSGTMAGDIVPGTANGVGTNAAFRTPHDVAVDASGGRVFVADTGNAVVRLVTIATGQVTTLAGTWWWSDGGY